MPETLARAWECAGCGHVWLAQVGKAERPERCPQCKLRTWDRKIEESQGIRGESASNKRMPEPTDDDW